MITKRYTTLQQMRAERLSSVNEALSICTANVNGVLLKFTSNVNGALSSYMANFYSEKWLPIQLVILCPTLLNTKDRTGTNACSDP